MEKKKVKKPEYEELDLGIENTPLSDYYNFNIQALASKIKMQNYKPKPKMLYL